MKKFLLAVLILLALPSLTTATSLAPLPADVDTLAQSQCDATLNINMRYRMRDSQTNNEVSALQDFLNAEGYLASEPTGFFGLATLSAVKKFQSASGYSPTGYVGPLTRAKVNSMSCGAKAPTPTATPPTPSTVPGCLPGYLFSSTTGKACSMTSEMGDPFNTLYVCNGVISHDPSCTTATTTPSKITVLFPNGGEEYLLDSDMKVMWSVSDLPVGGYIVAQLVGEGREITLGQTTHQTNTDNYYLSAKNNIVPGKYKVKLHIAGVPENLSAIDSSDGYIMISAIKSTLPAIKIISPIGQAYIYRGGSLNVNWSTVGVPDGDINQILIRLRSMDTNQEYNLTTSYNDSSETVIIPTSVPNGSYILEIKTSVYGQSYISTSDTTNSGLYLKVIDTPGVL